jgi:hypothetical protein
VTVRAKEGGGARSRPADWSKDSELNFGVAGGSAGRDDVGAGRRRFAASVVILLCLALQSVAGFRMLCLPRELFPSLPSPRFCAPKLWPFLDYAMYSRPHYAGDSIVTFFLVGVFEDSSEISILPADLNLGPFDYLYTLVPQLEGGTVETARRYAEVYQRTRGRKLIGLRLESHAMVLSRDGVTRGSSRIVREFRL